MIIPSYIKPGDTVGICCPSGALSAEGVAPMVQQLEFWGFEVKLGATVGTSHYKYSGTDKQRLQDVQSMLDDDNIAAILFGRGGYGMVRIIDSINFEAFAKKPKWLVGYSDICVLHQHLHTNYGIATMHAHMSAGYTAEVFDNDSTMSIYHALTGKSSCYQINTNANEPLQVCQGQLVGGNLAILSDLVGTNSDIDTKGKILLLEDIGEYRHSIDRMMWQLLKAGKLDHLAGLVVGSFTDGKPGDESFGNNEYEIIWEKAQLFNYPVCFGFPVGHQSKNMALKLGMPHELRIEGNKVELKELPLQAL